MARLETLCPNPVRFLRTGVALLATLLLPAFPAAADEAQDLKAAIVMRCYYAVGEFGAEMVDRCVKDDVAAAEALKAYPPEADALVKDCTDRIGGDGHHRIRACVDEAMADPARKK